MPAQSHDSTPLIVIDDFFCHTGEGDAVEVLLVAHLDSAKVEAHDGRIVAADVLHVTGVLLIFPSQTIHRIVLMAVHNTLLTEGIQTF